MNLPDKIRAVLRALSAAPSQDDPHANYQTEPTITPRPVEEEKTPSESWLSKLSLDYSRKPPTIGILSVALLVWWVIAVKIASLASISLVITVSIIAIFAMLRIIRGSADSVDDKSVPPEPDAPSKRASKGIGSGERLLYESREHPISLLKWWLGFAGLSIIAIALGIAGIDLRAVAAIWLLGIAAFGIRAFLWHVNRICITNTRLFVASGLVRIQYKTMPLSKMTDQTADFSAASNILAWLRLIKTQYVTLVVESAGQDQALSKVFYVPDGHRVNRLIVNLVSKEP